jgi:uncharacterized ferritin-like protein (DUF455 family)
MQLVQEARALDAHERLVQRVSSGGDRISMKLVNTICEEEVGHVMKGMKWFLYLCQREKLDPKPTFQHITQKYVDYKFTPPFNAKARSKAGMDESYWLPLSENR